MIKGTATISIENLKELEAYTKEYHKILSSGDDNWFIVDIATSRNEYVECLMRKDKQEFVDLVSESNDKLKSMNQSILEDKYIALRILRDYIDLSIGERYEINLIDAAKRLVFQHKRSINEIDKLKSSTVDYTTLLIITLLAFGVGVALMNLMLKI